jgi:Tol biopolymer transport system component
MHAGSTRKLARLLVPAIAVAALVSIAGPGTASATFAGSNGQLAFVRSGDIWVADPDGSNPTPLTTHPASERSPRWSPDGTRIAFASNRDGDFEIFVIDADGGGQTQITLNVGAQDRIPSWTADGTQIVYDKNFAEIYAVDANGGGGERKLVDGFLPGTSPHGEKVVLSAAGNDGLVTMHLDGSARRQVTDRLGDLSANWSPHANDLVFTRSSATGRDVHAVHANGTGLAQLTNTPDRFEFAPVWSPDGTAIAFVGCTGAACEIFVTDAEGGGEEQITSLGVSGGEGAVDWQALSTG